MNALTLQQARAKSRRAEHAPAVLLRASAMHRGGARLLDIADALGLTEYAVREIMARNPQLFQRRGSGRQRPSANPEGRPKADAPAAAFRVPVEYLPGLSRYHCERMPDRLPGEPLPLLELTDRTCRWPHSGAGADTLFCGGRIDFGAVYCGVHRAKAFTARTCNSTSNRSIS